MTPVERGESVPAGGVVSPAPGRLRVKNARPALRPVCRVKPAALGRPGAGNARSYLVPPQEARELELSGGVWSLPQVPWWNADRRARDASRAAASADAASWTVRLSAFRFLSFFFADRSVIEPKTGPTAGPGMTRSGSEGRFWQWRRQNSGAHASRERDRLSALRQPGSKMDRPMTTSAKRPPRQ